MERTHHTPTRDPSAPAAVAHGDVVAQRAVDSPDVGLRPSRQQAHLAAIQTGPRLQRQHQQLRSLVGAGLADGVAPHGETVAQLKLDGPTFLSEIPATTSALKDVHTAINNYERLYDAVNPVGNLALLRAIGTACEAARRGAYGLYVSELSDALTQEIRAEQGRAAPAAPAVPVVVAPARPSDSQLRQQFAEALDKSRDIAATLTLLKEQWKLDPAALALVDEAKLQLDQVKQAPEPARSLLLSAAVKPDGDMRATLLSISSALQADAENKFREYIEAVASAQGLAPLATIQGFLTSRKDPGLSLAAHPLFNKIAYDRCVVIIGEVKDEWKLQRGAQTALGITTLPPQVIDPVRRTKKEDRANYGPQARHEETLRVKGQNERNIVLGVGRPGNPEGYGDFAKDYGVWAYEPWVDWNLPGFGNWVNPEVRTYQVPDPSNPGGVSVTDRDDVKNAAASGVDPVLLAKDQHDQYLFERIHFRLKGVFPWIDSIRGKLVAGLGLYEAKLALGSQLDAGVGGAASINDMFTLGELKTIYDDSQHDLKARTAFYGDRNNEYAEAQDVFADVQLPADIAAAKLTYINDTRQCVQAYRTRYDNGPKGPADQQKLGRQVKWIADRYFFVPLGQAEVMRRCDADPSV